MRSLITLITLLFLGTQMEAQITIERADFTLEAGQTVVSWDLDFTTASAPEEGEAMVWDFGNLSLTGSAIEDEHIASSSSVFPEANLDAPVSRTTLGGLGVQVGRIYYLLDDTGHGPVGNIYEPIDVPLTAATGGATDILKVQEAVQSFSQRRTSIQFPLNYGDSWNYDVNTSTDYFITVAAFGLEDTPAGQTARDSAGLSVAGYGTIILPSPDGSGTVSVEALMVKRYREVTFNYTLGGQPAPALMLNALGLQQGAKQIITRYYFYAKGLPRSAANISIAEDGTFTSFTISDELKNLVTSTSGVGTETIRVKTFPSPARPGEMLSIEVPEEIQNGSFELSDMSGRIVFSTMMDVSPNAATQLRLPVHLQSGLYVYSIASPNKEVRGIGKLQIVR